MQPIFKVKPSVKSRSLKQFCPKSGRDVLGFTHLSPAQRATSQEQANQQPQLPTAPSPEGVQLLEAIRGERERKKLI